jgi:hypothetical protein
LRLRCLLRLGLMSAGLALACENPKPPAGSPSKAPSVIIRAKNLPPSPKDVIAAAFESATVPLTAHESCRNVGTEPTDSTLGHYLSGFAAELDPENGKNGLVTSVQETPRGWVCRLMIQRRAEEEVWSWGVEFEFGKDGILKPDSYRCIGAG